MFLFYNLETRKIISSFEMPLTSEEIIRMIPEGGAVVEKFAEDFPDENYYEMSNYFLAPDGQTILRCNLYAFEPITITAEETYEWTVLDTGTKIYPQTSSEIIEPEINTIVTFAAQDPGVYTFVITSTTYKPEPLTITVTMP